MGSLIGAVSLLLLAHHANSLPAPRQVPSSGGISIRDSMTSIINMYLQSQNVQSRAFYSLFDGQEQITWAGVGASGLDLYELNENLYTQVDRLPHLAGDASLGQVTFSSHYMHFIQALQNDTTSSHTTAQTKELNTLSIAQTDLCITKLGAATDAAYRGYQELHGTAKETDTIFIQFATENYGQYEEAMQNCTDAKDAYNKALDNINGDDAGIIQTAIDAMIPIIKGENTWYPGLNMPTSGPSNTTEGAAVGSQFMGTLVPFYAMSALNSTLATWQQGLATTPALLWNSSSDLAVTTSDSQSQGVSASWLFDSVSESSSSNSSFQLAMAKSAAISFDGIELIPVERGAWFDNWSSASAVGTPAPNDPLAGPHKQAFATYFGTADKPGPAAMYNDKALVVYKPRMTFTFASEADYNSAKAEQAQLSIGGLFGSVNAGQSSSSSGQATNASGWVLDFSPNTEAAYIVGFIMHSYWEESSTTR